MTSPLHLNLAMSSLGAKSHHQPQNTQTKKTKSHTRYTKQNKHTQEHESCTDMQASTLFQKRSPNRKQDHTYIQN